MPLIEQLYRVSSQLPPDDLAELLDFAEFLQQKSRNRMPMLHAARLADLAGGLEQSTTFSGEPLRIQEAMRHEWD
jgi:hypothetical protein